MFSSQGILYEEPATNLTRPIAKLIDLGYIEREIPFGESPKSSKKSFYRICDPFLSFHFKFVAPVYSYFNEQFSTYVGGWWEKICRDAVTGNIIDGNTYSEASRWWGNVIIDGKPQDVELDIVSE